MALDATYFNWHTCRSGEHGIASHRRLGWQEDLLNFLALTEALKCLNANWFRNLLDARAKISAWPDEHNSERPHRSLGYWTPNEFAEFLYRGFHGPPCSSRAST